MILQPDTIRIFIGFDNISQVAYHVLVNSILRQASRPVQITPICLKHFQDGPLTRPRDVRQSNDFAFARWLVPWLCNYEGWAIFTDNDMLFREDIANLWDLRNPRYTIQCVQHQYTPSCTTKFLGREQTAYERKNWSSVMLMNCRNCGWRGLDPGYVNRASGLELHQFKWLKDSDIGDLPKQWNHLVGEYPYDENASLVHWTLGGPWFEGYEGVDYADEWLEEYCLMRSAESGSHLLEATTKYRVLT